MDQIFITDLVAHGIIGVYDWERKTEQNILINIVLFTDLHDAGESDAVQDSVDYHAVAEKVRRHAETSGRQTVEGLATDLAELCLEEDGVQKVRVRVEKPGAVESCKSVGVEIERTKGQQDP